LSRYAVRAFIDSHAHLADPAFDADRDEVIARARAAGARAIVCIGESLAAAARAASLAAVYPGFVYWTAGVHPHDAARFAFDPDADTLGIHKAIDAGAVAVGECGLDYHYDHSPRREQRRVFALQLAIARERERAVVVHTRDGTLALACDRELQREHPSLLAAWRVEIGRASCRERV